MQININPKRLFENAKRFIQSMDWGEAIHALRLSLKKDFQENTLSYLMYCYLQKNDFKTLDKLIKQYHPRSGFSLYTLYWYYYLKGDLDEIPVILDEMLASEHYFLRCFALKELHSRGKIIDADKSISRYVHFTGLTYDIQLEEYRSSIYIDMIQGHYHLALAQIKLSLQDYPDFVDLHIDFLELVVAMNKESLILEVLSDAVLGRYAEKDYRMMWAAARAWYKIGRYEQAEVLLLRLRKQFPNNPLLYYHLANIWSRSGQIVNAIRAYKEAISLAPLFERAWYNLGTLYIHHGYMNDASRCLEEAIRIKKRPQSLHNLTYCLIETKRLEEAYIYLDQLPYIPGGFKQEVKEIKQKIREAVVSFS